MAFESIAHEVEGPFGLEEQLLILIGTSWTEDTRQSTEDKNYVNELKLLQKQTYTKFQKTN